MIKVNINLEVHLSTMYMYICDGITAISWYEEDVVCCVCWINYIFQIHKNDSLLLWLYFWNKHCNTVKH